MGTREGHRIRPLRDLGAMQTATARERGNVQQAFVVIGELTPSVPLSWGREGEGAVPMSNDWTSSFWTASRIG